MADGSFLNMCDLTVTPSLPLLMVICTTVDTVIRCPPANIMPPDQSILMCCDVMCEGDMCGDMSREAEQQACLIVPPCQCQEV